MKKNYNLYNLIGIGRNASEEEILDRMKRIERLKTSYSEELWKKIEEEYSLFHADRKAYDRKIEKEQEESLINSNEEKAYYTNNTFDILDIKDKNNILMFKPKEKEEDEMAKDLYAFVNIANEHALEMKNKEDEIANKKEANRSYKIYKEEKKKKKQARNLELKKLVAIVVCGVTVFVGARLVNNLIVKKNLDHNNLNNVCVQYEVKEGDTKNYLDDIFKEYGFSYYEVSGSYRDINKIYAGDTVIGITTKEKADKLVEEGRGKIISVDKAVELLSENNSLTPELKKYINGKSDVVFYIPTSLQK